MGPSVSMHQLAVRLKLSQTTKSLHKTLSAGNAFASHISTLSAGFNVLLWSAAIASILSYIIDKVKMPEDAKPDMVCLSPSLEALSCTSAS